jgi:hypothetical protein
MTVLASISSNLTDRPACLKGQMAIPARLNLGCMSVILLACAILTSTQF